ncbi:MAG: LysR family transcriptional regulator [Lachnospiraceae bacterium]|nr:LysR family transcriptional regulator [Lachnospiraceae bacterium]
MTDMQIKMFMELTRSLSFSKTAETFYTTQPTISRQIRMLEEEWGIRLFDRNKRQVKLTKAGKVMADFFDEHDDGLKKALQKAKRYKT